MIYLMLAYEFFKAGLFAIGGGMATLPFLYAMAGRYDWFTEADVANMLAVSESTPGPIGINMATYAGVHSAGILGGIVATAALVLPSIIVIVIIARMLDRFRDNPFVTTTMELLHPVSTGMVLAATISVLQVSLISTDALFAGHWMEVFSLPTLGLFAVILAVRLKFQKLHPIALIAIGAVGGIVLGL